jgi:DNA-binding GntR family transcriptional regulator
MRDRTAKPSETRTAPLAHQAYAEIRNQIITCALRPGTEVSEKMFADTLSMSKTPVREALARLSLEGFMETMPRRGYRVTHISVDTINELFAVREILEAAAGEIAARRRTAADLETLEALAAATLSCERDLAAFIEANSRFHMGIAAISGVRRLEGLLATHLQEATRLFYMGAHNRNLSGETQADHTAILDSLRAGDPAGTRRAIMAHNEHTRRGLLLALIETRTPGLTV